MGQKAYSNITDISANEGLNPPSKGDCCKSDLNYFSNQYQISMIGLEAESHHNQSHEAYRYQLLCCEVNRKIKPISLADSWELLYIHTAQFA